MYCYVQSFTFTFSELGGSTQPCRYGLYHTHIQGFSCLWATPWQWDGGAEQVWVGVLPRGPRGCALNSSYQSRESREYKEDLGYALVNIARLVPDGLLVFFPSYSVLTSCIDFWKQGIPGQSGELVPAVARSSTFMDYCLTGC